MGRTQFLGPHARRTWIRQERFRRHGLRHVERTHTNCRSKFKICAATCGQLRFINGIRTPRPGPERDGYTKADIRRRIQEVTTVPLKDLVADDVSGAGIDPARAAGMTNEMLNRPSPKFASEDHIHIVVAGSDAGKFSAAFHGWASGPMGSIPVSRKIDV